MQGKKIIKFSEENTGEHLHVKYRQGHQQLTVKGGAGGEWVNWTILRTSVHQKLPLRK